MKGFKKYQHVEKFGTDETRGIDVGECFVFPKIDGTNGSVWMEDDSLHCGSRKRELSLQQDNHGFMFWMLKNSRIKKFFEGHSNLRLFGEWLCPHTFKGYKEDAWNHFYVFDVYDDEQERYMHYNEYAPLLYEYDIEYIPPIAMVKNPTYERLLGFLERNYYLIPDGGEPGEGIVIKNYNYTNKFGRQTWAKIVRNDFKTQHSKNQPTEVKEKKLVEEDIVSEYVTSHLVEKEYAKIDSETGWTSKQIPRLLNTVYYCLITEEAWHFVKKHKNPTIDFGKLKYMTFNKVKEIKPELF